MEDVTRKRIMRKLEQLPEEQLYQVLDFIEFLELKYARDSSRKPDAFQQFAERLEDQMRVRSLAPAAMKSTMKVMSTAGKVIDGVRSVGKELVAPPDRTRERTADRAPGSTKSVAGGARDDAGSRDRAGSHDKAGSSEAPEDRTDGAGAARGRKDQESS